MDRREFIKLSGAAAAAAGVSACKPGVPGAVAATSEPEGNIIRHNPEIGLLGYGCMRWPLNDSGDIDQEEVNSLVDLAIKHGVNYFDTAPVYLKGQSELATAKALERYPRESYLLATKLSNFHGESATLEAGKAMFRHSLEIFNTDYLDYYLLHSVSGLASFNQRFGDSGLIDYLIEQRRQGHIRHLGFSFHGDRNGFDELIALHEKYHWDFVQIQMNYVDWTHAGDWNTNAGYLYGKLAELDIPVVIMEPLLGGSLSELPSTLSDLLKQREPERSTASWAFRFCGTFPKVQVILSGMSCREHLLDNLSTFTDFKPLSSEDMKVLEEVADNITRFPLVRCTGCEYCMPCPYGVNIPGIFSFYNRNVNAGTYATTTKQKHYARIRRRYLLQYDKAVPTIRQASHCIGCGKCLERCPQRIKIPDELQRIDRYIENLKRETLDET